MSQCPTWNFFFSLSRLQNHILWLERSFHIYQLSDFFKKRSKSVARRIRQKVPKIKKTSSLRSLRSRNRHRKESKNYFATVGKLTSLSETINLGRSFLAVPQWENLFDDINTTKMKCVPFSPLSWQPFVTTSIC